MLDDMLQENLQESLDQYGKGITIRSIRISKPTVPPEVAKRYEEVVASQARKLTDVTQGEEYIAKIELENKRNQAILEAENTQALMRVEFSKQNELAELNRTIEVNEMTIRMDTLLKEGQQNVSKIESETLRMKLKSEADSKFYSDMKEAEFKIALETDAFVTIETAKHMSNNAKVYAGFGFPDVANVLKSLNPLNPLK